MPHPKSTTTLSVVLALPILASGMASLNAQLAPGGVGTAGGAAASRSQIGVTSPPGVVLPNANGTGLGTSQPSYVRGFEGLNRNAAPGSFQVPRRAASTLGAVPQTQRTRCAGTAASTGAATTSIGTDATAASGGTTTSVNMATTAGTGTTTPLVSGAAQALAASTGSRPAGLTPIRGTGAITGNCRP
jgi:hypothetical protein